MRRKDREVTDPQQITDIMRRCEVLYIAFNDSEVPYMLPVNFGMDPDGAVLYIHGALQGEKYRRMEKDNRVSFTLVCTGGLEFDERERECSMCYESVIGRGVLEEVTGREEKLHALDAIIRHYRPEGFDYNPKHVDYTKVLRLCVQERTAKRRPKML